MRWKDGRAPESAFVISSSNSVARTMLNSSREPDVRSTAARVDVTPAASSANTSAPAGREARMRRRAGRERRPDARDASLSIRRPANATSSPSHLVTTPAAAMHTNGCTVST